MTRPLAYLLIASAIAGGAAPAHAESYVFNKDLILAYQHYQETLDAKRNTLTFDSGATANTCAEYLAKKHSSAISESINNRVVFQEYLICDSIQLLKQGHAGKLVQHTSHTYGTELMRRLDLRSFPSSLRQSIDDERVVLSTLKRHAVRAAHYSVTSDTNDWLFKIEVVADLDLDGNGKRDWVLWLSDISKEGNYRGYSVLIVRDPSSKGLLHAELAP